MEQVHEKQIPIWFFIGAIVSIYGILILGTGIYGWIFPPPLDVQVKLWDKHADVWWGIVLVMIGFFYVARYRPWKK